MRHSKLDPLSDDVNVKDGLAALDGSAGLPTMVVFGAVRSTSTLRSGLQTPVAQSALAFEHSKNWTCATPLPPASLAVAEKLVGLGSEPLIAAAGAVMATEGATLSTRMLVF